VETVHPWEGDEAVEGCPSSMGVCRLTGEDQIFFCGKSKPGGSGGAVVECPTRVERSQVRSRAVPKSESCL